MITTVVYLIAESIIISIFFEWCIQIFTNSEAINEIANSVLFFYIWTHIGDFTQGAIQGVIKALELNKQYFCISLIAYYVLIIPGEFLFAFYVGTH